MKNITYSKKRRQKDQRAAFFFLLPGMIIYLCFIGGPVIVSLVLSLFDYNILQPAEWVGLNNFIEFFTNTRTAVIFQNTLKYALILIPLHTVIGLLLALISDRQINRFMSVFTRTSVYFPYLITTASAAVAWFYILDGGNGVFNFFLTRFGLKPVNWLTDGKFTYLSLAIYSFWKYIGDPFLFYLVGLQSIADDYFEAAKIDGANAFQIFFRVKLPLLTPTVFYVLVIKTIHCFQVFEEPYLLTKGGPGDFTRPIALYLYDSAFVNLNMGYASTIAVVLFALTLAVTLLLFYSQKKWVCYDT